MAGKFGFLKPNKELLTWYGILISVVSDGTYVLWKCGTFYEGWRGAMFFGLVLKSFYHEQTGHVVWI